jgi:hypothetical protein
MKKEFSNFLNTKTIIPPSQISENILYRVKKDLNPSVYLVSGKLSLIHILVSLVTLSVCPQFGFRLLGEGMGLMHIFSVFGKIGCTIVCGFFFLGISLLVATLVLKKEEIKIIRKKRFLEVLILAFLSLGFFLMIDVEVVFGMAILWFFGSVLGGLILLEAGWEFRKRIVT